MAAKKSHKSWLYRVLALILVVIGLALVFNEQIKTMAIGHMEKSALTTKIYSPKTQKGNFDFATVKAVDNREVVKASMAKQKAIGKVAIPAVGLKLPIFYGLENSNLIRGAGTMKADQQLGAANNYALAGHHMKNDKILFGPLARVQRGDKIYLTDGQKVYTYTVTVRQKINETEVYWVDNVGQQKLVTLFTCASGEPGETNRIVVRGELTQTSPATSNNLKIFNR